MRFTAGKPYFCLVKTARTLLLIALFSLTGFAASAQNLSVFGLDKVRFGMHTDSLKGKLAVLDSTSAYQDTATYLRNTRCVIWTRPVEQVSVGAFAGSRVEYEFCDNRLYYAFFFIKGKNQVQQALQQIKVIFPEAGCGKDSPVGNCTAIDSKNKHFRIIATVKENGERLEFVVLPRKLKF